MLNLALAVILADHRNRQCPCGAVADRPHGLCRKCQDRNAWRRKTTLTHRKTNRRRSARQKISRRIHDIVGRFLVGALAVLLIINGLEA
jgi:signal transduction histidine kinase